jgi:hypothetical protein
MAAAHVSPPTLQTSCRLCICLRLKLGVLGILSRLLDIAVDGALARPQQ